MGRLAFQNFNEEYFADTKKSKYIKKQSSFLFLQDELFIF